MTTKREYELLVFIKAYRAENGYPASYDEMADHLGLKSKSGINRLINSLEAQGRVRRNTEALAVKFRCIEIVTAPLESWVHIGDLAQKLVDSMRGENIDDDGKGTVVVDAKAFGELDVALSEQSEASPERKVQDDE